MDQKINVNQLYHPNSNKIRAEIDNINKIFNGVLISIIFIGSIMSLMVLGSALEKSGRDVEMNIFGYLLEFEEDMLVAYPAFIFLYTLLLFDIILSVVWGVKKLIKTFLETKLDSLNSSYRTEKLLALTYNINNKNTETQKNIFEESHNFNKINQDRCNEEKHKEYRNKIKNTTENTENGKWVSNNILGEKTFICNNCGETIAYESDFATQNSEQT